MKVAFLFSGQLRELEFDLFRKSLVNLTKDLDYSIFGYTWKEMGKSLNHKRNLSEINLVENIAEKINFLFNNFNLLDFGYENFKDFKKTKIISEYLDAFSATVDINSISKK